MLMWGRTASFMAIIASAIKESRLDLKHRALETMWILASVQRFLAGLKSSQTFYYPNQVIHLEVDVSNLTADTGFVQQYTFEHGIRETVEWAKNNIIRFRIVSVLCVLICIAFCFLAARRRKLLVV